MAFKADNTKNKLWKEWLNENKFFLEACNLPEVVLKSKEHWEDFLLHGFLDHHEDESGFTIENLSTESQARLLEFLQNELDAQERESFVVFRSLNNK